MPHLIDPRETCPDCGYEWDLHDDGECPNPYPEDVVFWFREEDEE